MCLQYFRTPDTVDSSLIWTPKLRNWFAKDSNSFFEGKARDVKLFNNGTLYWIIASETRSTCQVQTRNFPYDKSTCSVAFSGEHASNYFFRALFSDVVISAYTQQNTDWKLLESKQWVSTIYKVKINSPRGLPTHALPEFIA